MTERTADKQGGDMALKLCAQTGLTVEEAILLHCEDVPDCEADDRWNKALHMAADIAAHHERNTRAQSPASDEVVERLQLAERTLCTAIASAVSTRATIHLTRARQIAAAVTEAIAALQSLPLKGVTEENRRLKLLVRAYVDPTQVKADMLPLVEQVNAEFDTALSSLDPTK